MRLNRNLRIGLALIGAAFLVWAASRVFNGGSAPRTANTNSTSNGTQTSRAPVEPVSLAVGSQRFVALQDIPERSIITRDMFRAEALPRDAPESAYITDIATQGQGFITRNRIAANTALRPSDLIGHISDVGVAGVLRPGQRAMIVPIANKPTLHDLVHIGDYVDVIAAFDQQEARTVVQNVRVLAVDVFSREQVRIAARGDYKADARGIATANPGSPVVTNQGATQRQGQGDGAASGSSTPPATPTPAPNGQPPAKPEPAITLEVTPDQATALSLSQASNAPLDFILRPRPAEAVLPETRVAASIKPRLAPYAQSVKNRAANSGRSNAGANNTSRNVSRSDSPRLVDRPRPGSGDFYNPPITTPLPPFVPDKGSQNAPPAPSAPQTYNIPVYAEGRKVNDYTVLKPSS